MGVCHDLTLSVFSILPDHEVRTLDTCANVEYDVERKAPQSRTLLTDSVTTAQECFNLCRSTKGCLSMTHHRLARRCAIHFESTLRVVHSGGFFTSAKSLCDAKGDMGKRPLKQCADRLSADLLLLIQPTRIAPIVLGGIFVTSMLILLIILASCLCRRERRLKRLEQSPRILETTATTISLCILKSLTPKHQ